MYRCLKSYEITRLKGFGIDGASAGGFLKAPNLYVKYSATSLRPPGHLLLANVRFGSKAFMRLMA